MAMQQDGMKDEEGVERWFRINWTMRSYEFTCPTYIKARPFIFIRELPLYLPIPIPHSTTTIQRRTSTPWEILPTSAVAVAKLQKQMYLSSTQPRNSNDRDDRDRKRDR
eukprot:scaffold14160_cov98-Skeletonema_dohrnii-CCMP3373.AAC.1